MDINKCVKTARLSVTCSCLEDFCGEAADKCSIRRGQQSPTRPPSPSVLLPVLLSRHLGRGRSTCHTHSRLLAPRHQDTRITSPVSIASQLQHPRDTRQLPVLVQPVVAWTVIYSVHRGTLGDGLPKVNDTAAATRQRAVPRREGRE